MNESALSSTPTKKPVADEIPTPDMFKCVDLGRYEVRGATVSDSANGGKLWQRFVAPVTRTQPDAKEYCNTIAEDGRTGWRLPTVNELSSIRYNPGLVSVGPATCSPSIDQSAFPDTPASRFWTSTVRPLGDAYYTSFSDGRSHGSPLDEPMFVRCVHDAEATVAAAAPVAD